MPSRNETHVVIFPFMAQGHTLPLLDLSKALSRQQIRVTIFTTPGNAQSISNSISSYPLISLIEIPFPSINGLPTGCENTSQLPSMEHHLLFVQATKQLQIPFKNILKSMVESESPPLCVISDVFLGWTFPVCQSFGIPRLVFHGMSVLSMAIMKTVLVHQSHFKAASVSDPLDLPSLNLPFTVTTLDVPEWLRVYDLDHPFVHAREEVDSADINSWGVVVNSFEEIEMAHISHFEAFYAQGAKAFCLGPLFLYEEMDDRMNKKYSSLLMKFLSEQIKGSVIFVSFGTQADVSDPQLDEVAYGLEESGSPFILLTRSKTWHFPYEIEEKIKRKGLIVKEWVDQRGILSHRSTGGFLSHCGWNSVLESISLEVPILAWPMMAEQFLNEKVIVNGLQAGLSVKREKNSESEITVSRQAISEGVRELMGGVKGRIARERAQALGRMARRAVQPGGSSDKILCDMIAQLRAFNQKGK